MFLAPWRHLKTWSTDCSNRATGHTIRMDWLQLCIERARRGILNTVKFLPGPDQRARPNHGKVRVAELRLLSHRRGSWIEPAFSGLLRRRAGGAAFLSFIAAGDGVAEAMSNPRSLE